MYIPCTLNLGSKVLFALLSLAMPTILIKILVEMSPLLSTKSLEKKERQLGLHRIHTDLAGYPAIGYPANNFAGYPEFEI